MLGPGGQGSDRQLAMAPSQQACQQGNCGGCARPPREGGRAGRQAQSLGQGGREVVPRLFLCPAYGHSG